MTVFLSIVLGTIGSIVAAELLDLCPALTKRLVAAAVSRVPPGSRERYLGEWLADLDHLRLERGKFAILLWAVGVYTSSGRLAKEVRPESKHRKSIAHYIPLKYNPFALDEPSMLAPEDIDIPTVLRNESQDKSEYEPIDRIGCSG